MSNNDIPNEPEVSVNSKLLELVSLPVFVKNMTGVYVACNDAFAEYLKLEKSKIIGATAFDLAPMALAKIYHAADHELFASNKTQIYTASVLDYEKKLHQVEFSKFILRDSQLEAVGFAGIIKDMTPQANDSVKTSIRLSQREIEILGYSAKGYSVKQIAKQLLVSHHTVAHHFKSIHFKLGVNNKTLAVIKAKEHNLID